MSATDELLTPRTINVQSFSETHAKVALEPLERGFGHTLGNALRRILLSSIEGSAIVEAQIENVVHEYSTLEGVQEDVLEILLNLKGVALIMHANDEQTITLNKSGAGVITAGDIETGHDVEIVNPDHVIANVNSDGKLNITMKVIKGRGYVPSEENKPPESEFGLIAIDSIFTPIKNVKYDIENYRVEQKTDYEKLIIDIETDGSVHPKDALKEAAKILIYHFMLFSDEKITLDTDENFANEEFDEEVLHMRQMLKAKLVDLDLSVRALNCLKAAEVETLGDLVKFNKNDLLKFRNFGKKSLTELEELLTSMNLSFGLDTSKYKLDKD